jgi:hypothetical protein
MVSKERRNYSRQQGDLAEKRFIEACKAIAYEVKKATAQEDIYSHIDYWVKRKMPIGTGWMSRVTATPKPFG